MLKPSVLSLVFAVASVGVFGALLARPGEGRKERPTAHAAASSHRSPADHGSVPANDVIPGQGGAGLNAHHGAPSRSAIAGLPLTAPVVSVNGVTFTRADLEKAIQQHAFMAGIPPTAVDGQMRDALEAPAYEKLIERELLGLEAKRRGLWPTDTEVQAQRDKLVAALPVGKTFEQALKVLGTDEASFMVNLKSDLAISKLFEAMKAEQPAVGEAKLRQVYEENKDKFLVPDSARASHILVRVEKDAPAEADAAALSKAKTIRAEVAGKDAEVFKKIAAEKSEDPSARSNGGDLGAFARGDMVAEFETAAFVLKDGEVSQPVRSPFGYHVIRGGGVTKGGQKSFEEVKQLISDREGMRGFMDRVDGLIAGLRKGARVTRIQEPMPSPVAPDGQGGSQVPGWKPGVGNARPGTKNPHGAG